VSLAILLAYSYFQTRNTDVHERLVEELKLQHTLARVFDKAKSFSVVRVGGVLATLERSRPVAADAETATGATTTARDEAAVQRNATEPLYLDLELAEGKRFAQVLPAGHNGFVYVYRGEVEVGGTAVPAQRMAILANDAQADGVEIVARAPTRVLLIAGRPLGESIAQYGPFVMNTQQEILTAIEDFRSGKMG